MAYYPTAKVLNRGFTWGELMVSVISGQMILRAPGSFQAGASEGN